MIYIGLRANTIADFGVALRYIIVHIMKIPNSMTSIFNISFERNWTLMSSPVKKSCLWRNLWRYDLGKLKDGEFVVARMEIITCYEHDLWRHSASREDNKLVYKTYN